MKVTAEMRVYEVDGKEVSPITTVDDDLGAPLVVQSHYNSGDMIVLERGSQKITVAARDMERAIAACRRAGL
jgi:hypothetical protein